VLVDETWTKTNMTRTHGRAPCGQRLIARLPPYSPDLNPIEMMFSKLKTLPRKADGGTHPRAEAANAARRLCGEPSGERPRPAPEGQHYACFFSIRARRIFRPRAIDSSI